MILRKTTRKRLLAFAAVLALIACDQGEQQAENVVLNDLTESAKSAPMINFDPYFFRRYRPTGFAGSFLSARYAQNQKDWTMASTLLNDAIRQGTKAGMLGEDVPETILFEKRAMILSAGAGDMRSADLHAKAVLDMAPGESLAVLVDFQNDIKNGDYADALVTLESMEEGSIRAYIYPVLKAWALAGQGAAFDDVVVDLTNNPLGTASVLLLGALHGKEEEASQAVISVIEASPDFSLISQTLSYYKALGQNDRAQELLERLSPQPELRRLLTNRPAAWLPEKMGYQAVFAILFSDFARMLINENNSDTAWIFAQMSLSLDKDSPDAHLLLAKMASEAGRRDLAIDHLKSIGKDAPYYIDARQMAASLLNESGRQKEAINLLKSVSAEAGEVEALIAIGDIYRTDENYERALEYYNKAMSALGTAADNEDHWHLFYARGIVLERLANWTEAEKDLRQALSYRPNDPYILNYLGYGWADQGQNLDESLSLIERAIEILPTDGYIADSHGWVLYKMARYEDAVPALEAAISLMPYDAVINDHLGDAYWRVGRKSEARFQWRRAHNYSEDTDLKKALSAKLESGLPPAPENPPQKSAKVDDGLAAR